MEIVAKAVFFIDGDETAGEYQSSVISHDSKLWLVATWLQPNAGGERIPEWLVPLEKLCPAWQEEGMCRLVVLMPRRLVSPDAPPQLLQQYGAVRYQSLAHIPAIGRIH